jgi:transcriptional regulator with XRE-family HTH domain
LAEIAVILKNSQIHFNPNTKEILIAIGKRIRFCRKLYMKSETKLCIDSGVARSTLQMIEKGNPGVSIGAYIRVMYMLGMERDLLHLGLDNDADRKLLDKKLKARSRMF